MQKRYDEIRQLGAEVLVVSSGRPEALKMYLAALKWPFPVVADPALESYRRFGLERTSWWSFLNPRILGRFLVMICRGWLPQRAYDKEDLLQLGGDFVLDGQRRLGLVYRSADAADRPSVESLIAACRQAVDHDCLFSGGS